MARLPTCGTRRFQRTAEPVDASTTPPLSSAAPSLGHVMPPGFPVIVPGNRYGHSRDPSPFGHRSSPEAPSLRRRYPTSQVIWASPRPCRPNLTLTGCRLARATPPSRASRPEFIEGCVHSPLPCVLPPIPRRNLSVFVSLTSRQVAAFPVIRAGRLPHYGFRGLLGVRFALRPA